MIITMVTATISRPHATCTRLTTKRRIPLFDDTECLVCDLLCRFDNDKVRVAEMKKQRKFKPF